MIERFRLKDNRIVVIKYLTKEDYDRDHNYEFVHSWLHEVSKYLNAEFNKEDLEKDKKMFYEEYLNCESEIIIGAIFEGKIVASTNLRLNDSLKHKHVGNWGLAIHPNFQNNGLGTKLLLVIESIAKMKGLKKLEADYYDGNAPAENLYINKLNYQIEGRKRLAILLKDGKFADKIMIGKIISRM